MRRKGSERVNATLIKRQIFLRMLVCVAVTGLFCATFYSMVRGNLGDSIYSFLRNTFFLDNDAVENIYQYGIRNHVGTIVRIGTFGAFAVALGAAYLSVSSYVVKLLSKANDGVNGLTDESGSGQEILLPRELAFLEDRLVYCQTVLRKRESDAKLAEQRKNDLVVYLAHDIKTPLTSVIGYLSLIKEVPDMTVEQRAKCLDVTLDKAYQLERLINEFFEITRYNLQTVELDKEDIDLYYMLFQMAEEFYPLLKPDGKTIRLQMAEDLTVNGDPDQLARVFNNILKNAISYGSSGSAITVTGERKNGQVVITFENTGRTIPQQKLNSIFEKFFRLDDARSTNTGGAGLGLAIAKEIIVLHGGEISASSEDGITTFTVVLP